jgi:hypothetical protein
VFVYDSTNDPTSDLRLAGFPAALIIDESDVIVDVRHPLTVSGLQSVTRRIAKGRDRRSHDEIKQHAFCNFRDPLAG